MKKSTGIGSKSVATIISRRDASGEITGWVVEMLKGKLKGLRYLCETRGEADAKGSGADKAAPSGTGRFFEDGQFFSLTFSAAPAERRQPQTGA
jgi:hypothetical protein